MVADRSDNGPVDEAAPLRPPPTIDLDPSEVSGDTANSAKAARLGQRWRKFRARLKPSLVRERGVVAGTAIVAGLIVVAALGSRWMTTAGVAPELQTGQSAAVDDLTARLSRLEMQMKAAPAPDASASRLAAIETQVGNVSSSVAELQRKADTTATALAELKSAPRGAPVDLAPLSARLARLEQTAGTVKSDTPSSTLVLRRALAAQALDAAVHRGAPFVELLAVIRRLTNDASALSPLDAFANSGVPNDAALSRALLTALPQAAPRAAEPPAQSPSGSFIDRLTANASRLIRIERIDAPSAQDVKNNASGFGRAEAAARAGNVAQARRELEAMPEADRAAVKSWLESVVRRDAALEASQRFVTSSLSALADDATSASSPPMTPAQ